jgi:hypothetical protein
MALHTLRLHTRLAAAAAAAAATFAAPMSHAAGTVAVNFVQPERYVDAGLGPLERERNLKVLAEHMQAWAERLPDGQQLRIEVLDVDLAGEQRLASRHPELRVLRGSVDWPRVQLKWQLAAGGQTLRQGDEHLADMGYLMFGARLRPHEALSYERRMLDDWLARQVLAAR